MLVLRGLAGVWPTVDRGTRKLLLSNIVGRLTAEVGGLGELFPITRGPNPFVR